MDPEDEGEAGGFSEPGLNDGNWTPVFLPATYEQLCPEVDHYEGAGWFRLRMKVDPAWRGRTVVFAGGGNSGRCQVWINGRLLINQEDPWLPFEARVPDDLVASGSLQLAVRTDNRPEPALVPGREYGWRNFGGITRPLFLEIVPRRRLAPPLVIPTLRDGVGRIRLKCQPAERTEAMKGLVRVTLHDGPGLSGQRVLRNRRLPAADGTAIVDCGTVEPWSPAHPNLYTLRCEWVDNEGGILDAVSRRVGFRQVRSAEGRILLNGEPIFLRGFNLHEDRAGAGPCEDPDGARADLEAMKAAGANAVRLAHYPHAASTLDLCDELGLLVLSEIPLYWLRRQGLNEAEFSAKAGRAARQLDALIQRDAHRPSVMLWAVSNEPLEGDPAVREVNHNLIMRARELDPTRLVAHVSCHFWHYEPDGPNFANDDAICVNAYPTWWDTDARKGPTSSLPQRGAD
ncbi:MAG: glycoside hydrolase family 2 protein, partial [Opitutales bacterium]